MTYVASETVKRVLSAESECDKILSEAYVKSDEIIAAAEADSNTEIQKAISRAKTDAQKLRDENFLKIGDFTRQTDEKYSALAKEIRNKADKNMSAAADKIISTFF